MEIRMEKCKELKQKPDQKHLGFGKYMTDYMFVMDWTKDEGWKDARIVPYAPITLRKNPVIPPGDECKENDQLQCKTLHAGSAGRYVCRSSKSISKSRRGLGTVRAGNFFIYQTIYVCNRKCSWSAYGNCIQIHGHLLSGRSLLCRGYQPG